MILYANFASLFCLKSKFEDLKPTFRNNTLFKMLNRRFILDRGYLFAFLNSKLVILPNSISLKYKFSTLNSP